MANIALIVGAGAVENAWKPVIEAIEKTYGIKVDSDGANCFITRIVYLMRYYHTWPMPPEMKDEIQVKFERELSEFKNEISKELLQSEKSNQIRPRPEFINILSKFIFPKFQKFILFSTNWDTVINNEINRCFKKFFDKHFGFIEAVHIHGSVISPNGLYLPSEVVKEPYRTKEDDDVMTLTHFRSLKTLEQCNTSILYGLSLDPLDAELSQTLASGWSSPNLKEIIIINPEHKKVSQRVKLLMDSRYLRKIFGYSPLNLNDRHEY